MRREHPLWLLVAAREREMEAMSEFVGDLTTEEGIEYALDPRNDSGEPDSLHVMAQNYDSDCPNYDDHELDENGFEVCLCWDGITADDVATWTEDGKTDPDAFGEWGPFRLFANKDPGPPRKRTYAEALADIERFMSAASLEYGAGGRLDINQAMSVLGALVDRVTAEDERFRQEEEDADPCGHEMGYNLCVYCLQYDVDPSERCPERDDDDCD